MIYSENETWNKKRRRKGTLYYTKQNENFLDFGVVVGYIFVNSNSQETIFMIFTLSIALQKKKIEET